MDLACSREEVIALYVLPATGGIFLLPLALLAGASMFSFGAALIRRYLR